MSLFTDATLEIGYFDARPGRGEVPAQVAFEESGMTLVVRSESEPAAPVLYHGRRRGQGHYVLSAPDAGVDGTLHRFAESTILEGFWRSGAERGFWRLHLPADAVLSAMVASPQRRRSPRTRARANGNGKKKTAPRRARSARRRHATQH